MFVSVMLIFDTTDDSGRRKNMRTVMIVDSQKRMLNIYKKMLHWEEYGFEIISFTDNQAQAMSYFREYEHDLIIMDTQLKNGNGLALIKQLKEYKQNCYIIVCSYENNYNNIRRAWRLGILDFLKKDALRCSLLTENLEIIQNEEQSAYQDMNGVDESQRLLGLIRDKQSVDLEKLNLALKRSLLLKEKDIYRILFFRMDNPTGVFLENLALDRDILSQKLKEIFEDVLSSEYDFEIIFSKKHSGTIIIKNVPESQLDDISQLLIEKVKSILKFDMSIIISKECIGYSMFYDAYVECINSLNRKFYTGNCSIIFLDKSENFNYLDYKSIDFKEKILKYLVLEEYEKLNNVTLKLYHYMINEHIMPSDVIYYCCYTINSIEHYMEKRGIKISERLLSETQYTFSKLENISDIMREFTKTIRYLTFCIQSSSQSKYLKIVLDVNQYIEEHISNKIDVNDIADTLGLTAIHISRVFKQQNGESLVQYINKQKMIHAIYLMKNSKLKIKDIAQSVGFDDQLYFNKVFKKYYDVSPREFRKQFEIQKIDKI